jgi:hypothetical protein
LAGQPPPDSILEGFELKDLLRRDAPMVKVVERTATRDLVKWDIFGARLARQDDSWVLTGALYPDEG